MPVQPRFLVKKLIDDQPESANTLTGKADDYQSICMMNGQLHTTLLSKLNECETRSENSVISFTMRQS